MTPEELEALADRVEAESGTPAYKQIDLDRLIFSALGTHVLERRDRDRKAWWYPINGSGARRDDDRSMFGIPRFLSSLDAAAQVMPPNWAVTVEAWPASDDGEPASVKVVARECQPDRKAGPGVWHNPVRNGRVDGTAPTECDARVAAGLRARAHVLRNGGAV